MMDVRAMIGDFRRRGIQLEPRGGFLAVRPAERLTDQDRALLRSHKPEIMSALAVVETEHQREYRRAREVVQWCEQHRIDASIGAAIIAIEDDALKFGWSPRRLWGFCLWPIEERGLAALLDAGDHLKLHLDYIEITKADGNTQRFWLRDS